MKLKVGVVVSSRFGVARVERIEITDEKYGTHGSMPPVEAVSWGMVRDGWVVVDLDNGHWQCGVDIMPSQAAQTDHEPRTDSDPKVVRDLVPKKISPFRVRVTGGPFEGVTGTAVRRCGDDVFVIDTDDGSQAFASAEQMVALARKKSASTVTSEHES